MIFPREKNHNHHNEALTLYRLLKKSLYGAYGGYRGKQKNVQSTQVLRLIRSIPFDGKIHFYHFRTLNVVVEFLRRA